MIKRSGLSIYAEIAGEDGIPRTGNLEWVLHSDYTALQSALKEALDQWEPWMTLAHNMGSDIDISREFKRIAELRKEFL